MQSQGTGHQLTPTKCGRARSVTTDALINTEPTSSSEVECSRGSPELPLLMPVLDSIIPPILNIKYVYTCAFGMLLVHFYITVRIISTILAFVRSPADNLNSDQSNCRFSTRYYGNNDVISC